MDQLILTINCKLDNIESNLNSLSKTLHLLKDEFQIHKELSKNYMIKLERKITRYEQDIQLVNELDKKLDEIKEIQNEVKKDTQRMDDHITYVEDTMINLKECMNPLKSFSPMRAISAMNPFKSIQDNNKTYLERGIINDVNEKENIV